MLLITITRLPKGYRLLATTSYQMRYYCWSLYRNCALLTVISRSYHGENSVNFDLFEPLAPGHYELRVECFAWPIGGQTDAFAYSTEIATVTRIH